jgi:hypothetical protein
MAVTIGMRISRPVGGREETYVKAIRAVRK